MTRSLAIACSLLVFLSIAPRARADATGARAWLDRDTMQLGETVTLNVEATGSVGAAPDFSALSGDFRLLGTQSSRQLSIVNGASTSKTLWAVGLEPRHDGKITIPALDVGNAVTTPLILTVLPQPAGAQGEPGDDVFLEVNAQPLAPYVQQQVRYTVKLYYAFDLTDGNLAEPHADSVVVQRLGQDKHYLANVGSRRYHVIERHYALKPEQSGVVTIPGLVFRGTALDAGDPTGFFSRGRSVDARSDAVQLDVRPKPGGWGDTPWLPAASLTLQDESALPARVHVGDPVTRTIRVQAKGLGYEQLPEITLAPADGAEIYPDKAQTNTRDDGSWLYGERVRKFAFVPTRPGELVVPGYTVRWWNTEHDRAETAQLPTHAIEVLPAVGGSAPAAPPLPAAPSSSTGARPATTTVPSAAPATAAPVPPRSGVRFWQLLAPAGFILWLVTLGLWWRSRRAHAAPARVPVRGDEGVARPRFLRACALGDLAGAERALVAWAHDQRQDVRNLGELAARLVDPKQLQAIAELQRVRYAGAPGDGLAGRLERAFKGGLAWSDGNAGEAEASALPGLYP
ncbi:MAG TPA: BatD family protein [Rhodanobacteraceae bacterium]|nr:BatD family protein [Rhodanobacteraceae bacterium]